MHYKKYETRDIIVFNPETGERYNCSEIINKLDGVYKFSKEKFGEYVELLNSCIGWSDNIDRQFEELKRISNSENELNQNVKKQLDKVVLYATKKNKPYQPIQYRYKELYLAKSQQKSISFLCSELDRLTGGIQPGTICTIAGGPGSMKTTTAVNIAYQAVKDGKNVLYLSLEETEMQLFSKLLSRISVDILKPINHQDITNAKLSEDEQRVLFNEVLPYLDNLPGSFQMIGGNDLISYEFTEIERQFSLIDKYIKSTNNDDHGIDLVVVDHIQLLKYASNVKDEYKVMNEYVSFFRNQSLSFLGEDRQISIILLSQVNREGIGYAKKHNGMYLMQHVAEASEVERASTYIISTYTDAMSQTTKLFKVGALKLRNAQLPMDTINVFADGAYYQVGDPYIPEQNACENYVISADNSVSSQDIDYSLDDLMEGLIL